MVLVVSTFSHWKHYNPQLHFTLFILHFTFISLPSILHLLHFLPVSSFGNNRNNFFLTPRTGPCGTTLATAFGSDLRSVDTLGSSRFALTQPDCFATGVFPRGALESARRVAPGWQELFLSVVMVASSSTKLILIYIPEPCAGGGSPFSF